MRISIFMAAIVLLLLVTCRKEQPELSLFNEACDCAHEVSAAFTIEEISGLPTPENELRTLTDTAYSKHNIRFHALEEDAIYTWYIGSEVINDRTVYRYFPEEFSFQDIHISLRVDKYPHEICFPNDDGVDSLQKILSIAGIEDTFYDDEFNHRFDGVFRFYDSFSEDSVDLKIERWYFGQGTSGVDVFEHLKIINMNSTGDFFDNYLLSHGDTIFLLDDNGRINYREFWFTAGGYSDGPSLSHDINGKVEFSLITPLINEEEGVRTFTGRKLY